MNYQDSSEHCNPIPFVNSTSDRIPPGAVLANAGSPDTKGRKLMGKPTSDGQTGCYLNSPFSVEEGDAGWCSYHTPFLAAYDVDGPDVPAIGETWGPEAGSWYLAKDQPGFLIDGDPDEGLVPVLRVGTGSVPPTRIVVSDVYPDALGRIRVTFAVVHAPAALPITGPYTIAGRVTLDVTDPAQGYRVHASTGQSTITDSNGDYVLDNIVAGTIIVMVEFDPAYTISPVSETITTPGSATGVDFDITT